MSVRVPTSRSANKLQFSLFCGSPETSFSCADSTTTPKQAELFLLYLIANQNTIIIIKVKLKSTSVIVVFGRFAERLCENNFYPLLPLRTSALETCGVKRAYIHTCESYATFSLLLRHSVTVYAEKPLYPFLLFFLWFLNNSILLLSRYTTRDGVSNVYFCVV